MAYRLDPAQPCKRQDHREALFSIGEPTYSLFRLSLIYWTGQKCVVSRSLSL
jgi:hypothetical protein